MCVFKLGSPERYGQFKFLQFPFFYVVPLAKRQWSGFRQTHSWATSKCEQPQRRPLLSLRGAEAKECVKHSSQLQTLRGELDLRLSCSAGGSELTWAATSEVCACFYDCLWCRQGRNGERLGCLGVSWWGMRGEDQTRLEWRQEQSWMSYDALVGSLVSGLWKQPFNPQPLIFHLLFRVHRSSEI